MQARNWKKMISLSAAITSMATATDAAVELIMTMQLCRCKWERCQSTIALLTYALRNEDELLFLENNGSLTFDVEGTRVEIAPSAVRGNEF